MVRDFIAFELAQPRLPPTPLLRFKQGDRHQTPIFIWKHR